MRKWKVWICEDDEIEAEDEFDAIERAKEMWQNYIRTEEIEEEIV